MIKINKNSIKFLIITIFIISESQIFSYYKEEFYRDYNKYNEMNSRQLNYDDYNSYKRMEKLDYKEFQKLESREEGNFKIEARDEFLNNPMNKQTYNLYNRNDNWSLDKNVASNINAYDYCGYKISENKTVESYSYMNKKYEPIIFNNVKVNDKKEIVSFNMTTTKGDWQIRNEIRNIEYNDKQEIKRLEVKTKDIAGNELEQKISSLEYESSKDFSRLKDKIKESEEKGNREGYFNFEKLAIGLKEGEEPAKELPKTFQIETKDPVGEKQIINFEKVNWEADKIVGFEATVKNLVKKGEEEKEEGIKEDKELTLKDKENKNENEYKMTVKPIKEDSGRIMGFNVKIEDGKEAKEINWTKESKDSLENLVGQKIKGINPINIMGSEKVQIGKGEKSTKIAILGVNYTDKGILEKVEVKTKNHEIDYGITSKRNEKNSLRRDLHRLEQISPSITRNELKDKNIGKMKTKELREEVKEIGQKILNKASKILEKKSEIKSNWGEELKIKDRLEIELKAKEDNSYVMVSKLGLENEKGEKVEEVELVIAGGEVKAIGGKINRKDGSKEIKTGKYKEAEITKIKRDGIIDKSVRGIKNAGNFLWKGAENLGEKIFGTAIDLIKISLILVAHSPEIAIGATMGAVDMVLDIGKFVANGFKTETAVMMSKYKEENKSQSQIKTDMRENKIDFTKSDYLETNINNQGTAREQLKVMIQDIKLNPEGLRNGEYLDVKPIYDKFEDLGIKLCTSAEVVELKGQMDKILANNPDINFGEIGIEDLKKLDPKLDTGLFQELRDLHYTKNLINREQFTLQELVKNDFKINGVTFQKMPWYASFYHVIGMSNIGNKKYVSEDGRFEVVFNKKGELVSANIDAKNMGTYNVAPSTQLKTAKDHGPCDVDTYEYFGNANKGAGKLTALDVNSAIMNFARGTTNPITIISHVINSIKGNEISTWTFIKNAVKKNQKEEQI
jgi:hypothetical protein